MALAPGVRLGRYEVVAQIGVGGMGEVYRATDGDLQRSVAIKVLPDEFAGDAERLARFEREARTLASLNHPGIAIIHGFEKAGSSRALVMEFVDGPTLADRIAEGPLPVNEALAIARQIADALQAAHDQGVIHRDLKPANIKLRDDGAVKVLDFGLAKSIEPAAAVSGRSMSPTITSPAMTQAGVILGTAAYMSPEQAKGRGADKRSDVWALGCVMFEMLSGKRAFDSDDVSDTFALVLRGEPEWAALPADVPPAVVALLKRMLEKDRRHRVADVAAVSFVLGEPSVSGARATAPRRVPLLWVATAVVGGIAVAGISWWAGSRSRADDAGPITRLAIPLIGEPMLGASSNALTLSPDGKYVAFNASRGLYLRPLDRLEASLMPGTENNITTSTGLTRRPKFSPDSRWIAFAKDGGIRKAAVAGGPPVPVAPGPGITDFAWEPDGHIVYLTSEGLFRMPETGGQGVPIVNGLSGRVQSFQMLPGAGQILLTRFPGGTIDPGKSEVVVHSIADHHETIVLTGGLEAQYVPTGHLVYFAGGSLLAVRFDLGTLTIHGAPEPVADRVLTGSAPGLPIASAHVAISPAGTLAYIRGDDRRSGLRTLMWVDRSGREEPLGFQDEQYVYPRLSPDNRFIGVTVRRDTGSDIWILDVARKTTRALTTDQTEERYSIWTGDGKRVLFGSSRGDDTATWWQSADGSGTPRRIAGFPVSRFGNFFPTSISPQAERLVATSTSPAGADIWLVPLPAGEPTPLLQTPATERNGEISPDGKWLAYESIENGQFNIFVCPFPRVGDGRWPVVTTGGGSQPMWSRDGKELFYVDGSNYIVSVGVESGSSFTVIGTPRRVLPRPYVSSILTYAGRLYDISRDGKRLLVLKDAGVSAQTEPLTITIVQNFFEELRKR
jgi:serine/threonine-protein kinase